MHGIRLDYTTLRRIVENESNDGRALAQNPANNPICTVEREDSAPWLFVRWNGYATSAQIRYFHQYLLNRMKQERVSRILADDTALVTIGWEDQDWAIGDWIPRAVEAGLRRVATKGPKSNYGRLSVGRIQALSRKLIIKTFDDLAEAREWLRAALPV